jgi:hypothetical protein
MISLSSAEPDSRAHFDDEGHAYSRNDRRREIGHILRSMRRARPSCIVVQKAAQATSSQHRRCLVLRLTQRMEFCSRVCGPDHPGFIVEESRTLAVATFMTKFMQSEQVPVLWALQSVVNNQPVKTTPLQILRYLAMQALRQNQDTIGNHISESFNQTRISSAHTIHHWTTILKSAIESVPIAYVLIDLDLIDLDDSSTMLPALLQSLSDLTDECKPTVLKVVLINKLRTVSIDMQSSGSETLNLEKILNNSRISRARGRQQASNTPLRGAASLAFRSRLKNQSISKAPQRSF